MGFQQALCGARTLIEGTGTKRNPDDHPALRFGVIFAGYVKHKPGVYVVLPPGLPARFDKSFNPMNEPEAFGGGAPISIAAWNVLKRFHPNSVITKPEALRKFMNAVCTTTVGLAPPVDIWRIDKSDSQEIPRG